jgi:hypothetical protein
MHLQTQMSLPLSPATIAEVHFERARPSMGEVDSFGAWEEQLELGGEFRLTRVVMIFQGGRLVRFIFAVDFDCLGAATRSRLELAPAFEGT